MMEMAKFDPSCSVYSAKGLFRCIKGTGYGTVSLDLYKFNIKPWHGTGHWKQTTSSKRVAGAEVSLVLDKRFHSPAPGRVQVASDASHGLRSHMQD